MGSPREEKRMRWKLAILVVCLVAATVAQAAEIRRAEKPVAGQYIVVFKDDAARGGTWRGNRARGRGWASYDCPHR